MTQKISEGKRYIGEIKKEVRIGSVSVSFAGMSRID
jgi:hypothetical protein